MAELRKYETVFIAKPNLSEDEFTALLEDQDFDRKERQNLVRRGLGREETGVSDRVPQRRSLCFD